MDKKNLIKKTALTVCIILAALLVLAELVLPAILRGLESSEIKADEQEASPGGYNFWETDADDTGYEELDSEHFWFEKDDEKTLIPLADAEEYGDVAHFFAEYFGFVKKGSIDDYICLFSPRYFTYSARAYDKVAFEGRQFTPQRLYDMEVEVLGELDNTETGSFYGVYLVSYKIFHNDGSFRTDIQDGYSLPLVFELESDDGILFIKDIYQRPTTNG